ncbi:Protein piccolo [Frankliniella fusca]|uniref:Protein piccolo n=1 Tax=Frankliniella fusca TaxID=407009 RepID=A0AAE1H561_9NEOP|nr:Protein piccolo [Frankliniella fusca]
MFQVVLICVVGAAMGSLLQLGVPAPAVAWPQLIAQHTVVAAPQVHAVHAPTVAIVAPGTHGTLLGALPGANAIVQGPQEGPVAVSGPSEGAASLQGPRSAPTTISGPAGAVIAPANGVTVLTPPSNPGAILAAPKQPVLAIAQPAHAVHVAAPVAVHAPAVAVAPVAIGVHGGVVDTPEVAAAKIAHAQAHASALAHAGADDGSYVNDCSDGSCDDGSHY